MNLSKFVILIFSLTLFSCNRQEYHFIDEASREWLEIEQLADQVVFVDDNEIASVLSLINSNKEFSVGTGHFMFFKTETSYQEYRAASFRHDYLDDISLSIYAGFDSENDRFTISGRTFSASFDMITYKVDDVSVFNVGGESQYLDIYSDDIINSTAIAQDNFELNGIAYDEVIIFELKDFLINYPEAGITKVIIAKGVGIVGIGVKSGVFLGRK